eukprot:CAMPEP_0172178206 /NCGR_PEP_ID=MMETSP1050-20130122/15891_1 /TAXON_ID=233186 /ORGANISM="Cryptomonas curvata, Strain CCAP979/52" /LENGTH=269 /DNA_ID=CAMNT_0012850867 /DNA_START=110 /DNA_END=915 /DNA_ORIENTATION=+
MKSIDSGCAGSRDSKSRVISQDKMGEVNSVSPSLLSSAESIKNTSSFMPEGWENSASGPKLSDFGKTLGLHEEEQTGGFGDFCNTLSSSPDSWSSQKSNLTEEFCMVGKSESADQEIITKSKKALSVHGLVEIKSTPSDGLAKRPRNKPTAAKSATTQTQAAAADRQPGSVGLILKVCDLSSVCKEAPGPRLWVKSVLPDSPADQCGQILPGFELVRIQGRDVGERLRRGEDLRSIAADIAGAAGTPCSLAFHDHATDRRPELSLTRAA